MFVEVAKYQVFPLDASVATRLVYPRPSLIAGRTVFTYSRRTGDRHSGRRRAQPPQHLLHHHGRNRRSEGWRRGHDRHPRRAFRRLRLVPAQGQAGFHLEPARLEAGEMARRHDALAPGKHKIVYDFKYDGLGFATSPSTT